jgi:hypothetical protein
VPVPPRTNAPEWLFASDRSAASDAVNGTAFAPVPKSAL